MLTGRALPRDQPHCPQVCGVAVAHIVVDLQALGRHVRDGAHPGGREPADVRTWLRKLQMGGQPARYTGGL